MENKSKKPQRLIDANALLERYVNMTIVSGKDFLDIITSAPTVEIGNDSEEDSSESDFYKFSNKVTPYRVDMVEYERGWGSKLDETLYFNSKEEAQNYANTYNAENNKEAVAPDYYIIAKYVGI